MSSSSRVCKHVRPYFSFWPAAPKRIHGRRAALALIFALAGTAIPLVPAIAMVTAGANTSINRAQLYPLGRAVSGPTYTGQIYTAGGIPPLSPNATALASDGTLYASDEAGLRIVSVDPLTGAVTSVSPASNGWSHPSGLYLESDQKHLLVADKDNGRIVEIDTSTGAFTRVWGGRRGTVDAGDFNAPEDMTMDSTGTDIYVNDTYNHRVVALKASDGTILWTQSNASGTGHGCDGSALLRNRGITFGSDGNLYIADTDQGRIVELDPASGSCLAVLGGKGTVLGALGEPRGIDSDGNGGLWVAENSHARIHHISLSGTSLWVSPTTFGGSAGQFRSPHGVQFLAGSGTIYVSDTFDYRIAIYTENPNGSATFSSYITEPYPANAGFSGPFGVAYDPSGRLYVVDHFNDRAEQFDSSGNYLSQIGGAGVMLGSFNFPRGILVIPSTSTKWAGDVMICDSENHRMQIFTPASFSPGGYGTQPVARLVPVGTTFLRPQQIFLSPVDGSLWAADTNHRRILNIDLQGNVLHQWTASGNLRPTGIAVDTAGNVYVTGTNLSEYDATGKLLHVLAPTGSGAGDVRAPDGMAIDGAETLYVADTRNNRVDEFDLTTQSFIKSFGTLGSGDGQFVQPYMVAIGPTGQIAVSDFGNNRVSLWQA